MPRLFTRSERAASFIAGLIFLGAVAPAWAHRRTVGFGIDTAGNADSNGFALTMAFVIGTMIVALLGALFYFRWRTAHPLPEPDSVSSVVVGHTQGGPVEKSEQGWEKPADWWKPKDEAPDS